MTVPDQKVIDNLQKTAAGLASLSCQFRVDIRLIHAMGLKWLQHRIEKWYHCAESQLDVVVDRLLAFDTDPSYECGTVAGASSVLDVLTREQVSITGLHTSVCNYRKEAWDTKADYTPDIFEHVIESLEKILIKVEQQIALIKKLSKGGEANYIASRLEDGD